MKVFRKSAVCITLGSMVFAVMAVGVFAAATLAMALAASPARAEATLLIDAKTGKVLKAHNAAEPWYPASLSKLMTLYVTLSALHDHRIGPDTLFRVSRVAHAQAPTKMGFRVGTKVTVDNAIKMMMVKSANDIAVVLAEGVAGSVDKFAKEMTLTAQMLGMTESHFVNPNGLPASGQITSARDLAILARDLIRKFPQYSHYWDIRAIRFHRRVIRNYNPLLGRFPGANGMKTGFICAGGFNLVATAKRGDRQLIAVVLGAPSGSARAMTAAKLLESGFNRNPLSFLLPSLGTVDQIKPIIAAPPDLKDEICGRHRRRQLRAEAEDEAAAESGGDSNPQFAKLLVALRSPAARHATLRSDAGPVEPIVVYTGPVRHAGAAGARRARAGKRPSAAAKMRSARSRSRSRKRARRPLRAASRAREH